MEMTINEHGFWDGVDMSQHLYDTPLAQSILHLIIQNQWIDVIDIGCGTGYYTKLLQDNGIPCDAYDGNPNTPEISHNIGRVADFAVPQYREKKDLVLCLEVGEHIPKEFEQTFLYNITSHAKKAIILSWALPGQDGFGHVNCQTNDYIVDEIEKRGFRYNFNNTTFLRARTYRSWFKRTTLVFDYDNSNN